MSNDHISTMERKYLILNHPFFAMLSDHDAENLAEKMEEIEFNPLDSIVEEGETLNKIFFLARGEAEATRQINIRGSRLTKHVGYITSGELIGLTETGAYANSVVYPTSVTAISHGYALAINLNELNMLAFIYPAMHHITEKYLLNTIIKSNDLFSMLTNHEIERMSKAMKRTVLHPGNILFQEGEPGHESYFILVGGIDLIDPKSNNIHSLTAGKFFSEAAVLHPVMRRVTAVANSETILYALNYKLYSKFLSLPLEPKPPANYSIVQNIVPIRNRQLKIELTETLDKNMIDVAIDEQSKKRMLLNSTQAGLLRTMDGKKTIKEIFALHSLSESQGVPILLGLQNLGLIFLPDIFTALVSKPALFGERKTTARHKTNKKSSTEIG